MVSTNKQNPNQSAGYFFWNVPKRNLTFIGEVFHFTSRGIIIYSGLGERLFFFFSWDLKLAFFLVIASGPLGYLKSLQRARFKLATRFLTSLPKQLHVSPKCG